jgi:hypothetical protein
MASMNMPERHITLQNGTKVLIRPLTIEDAKLYPDFVHEVSSEDLRLRFFAALREISPRWSTSSSISTRLGRWLSLRCLVWCVSMTIVLA